MTEFWSFLWDASSWITVSSFLVSLAKKYLFKKKKSPINKSLENDVLDIAEKWATDTDVELTYIMHDKFNTLWVPVETENNIYDLWEKEDKETDKFFKQVFSKTIEKAEWFLDLIGKQIDWYESGLNISPQLKNEKDAVIKQLWEDLSNYINLFIPRMENLCKTHWIDENEIKKWIEMFSELKDLFLKKIENLCDKIIWRISKS